MPASHAFHLVRSLSPDGAVALASLGILLLFVEFNRPGSILPASLGLLLLLLSSATLFHLGLQIGAVSALVAVLVAMGSNLYYRLPASLLVFLTCGWVLSLRFLVRPRGLLFVHTPVAVACGGTLGLVSAVLTRVARRARRAKALN